MLTNRKASIKNTITALFVEKKLPELLKGKNSKNIIKKEGTKKNFSRELKFLK